MTAVAERGRSILSRMSAADRAAVIEAILNVPNAEHFDRVARINASIVRARGEAFYGPNGYRNPALLEGCNIVRAYLIGLARDNCVVLGDPD